jgi:hypothetical protein
LEDRRGIGEMPEIALKTQMVEQVIINNLCDGVNVDNETFWDVKQIAHFSNTMALNVRNPIESELENAQ